MIPPNADTVFPNHFEIDYVRVYQPAAAPAAEAAVLVKNDAIPGKPPVDEVKPAAVAEKAAEVAPIP